MLILTLPPAGALLRKTKKMQMIAAMIKPSIYIPRHPLPVDTENMETKKDFQTFQLNKRTVFNMHDAKWVPPFHMHHVSKSRCLLKTGNQLQDACQHHFITKSRPIAIMLPNPQKVLLKIHL